MVCVNYSDIAAITIPYNRHHFDRLCVVTDMKSFFNDAKLKEVCEVNRCEVMASDYFYTNHAIFNKWAALEEGIDHFGLREPGWLCIMDADVLWPKRHPLFSVLQDTKELAGLEVGKLYSPLRRMWSEWPNTANWDGGIRFDPDLKLPQEEDWKFFSVHRNVAEWAGYSQVFHTSDPVLGPAPWHQIDWKHCGGADSFFQKKWDPKNKIRPPFECLHLGPAGKNWYGRATTLADGSSPPEAKERLEQIDEIWRGRAIRRAQGKDLFEGERI